VGKRHPQELIAAAVMAVVLTLIAFDLVDHSFNTWFDRHSFSTDAVSTLLGLAVAALVVDRISDRRRLRDRAQVMAAQGAMIAAQALRATQAVTSALDGSGDREAAGDELRTFMTMMLTGAPVLMDALQTREFLETS
jgi:predicted Co/Zn/Cd cation transporter (cation efflux family)